MQLRKDPTSRRELGPELEGGHIAMKTPPIVSPQEWEAARQQLLVKEKDLTRARDAVAAERRRMPWLAVRKEFEFDGPKGKASLLDLFEGRRQLIVYRAFFEPGVFGWPENACRGCSLVADQVAHVAHLNARDTTLAFVSRAPQPDIESLKARMGWKMPWYAMTDDFDTDFGVDEWHGTNAFIQDGDSVFRHLELPRHDRARTPGGLGGLARGLPPNPTLRVVELARRIRRRQAVPVVERPRPRRPRPCRPPTAAHQPPEGRRRHMNTHVAAMQAEMTLRATQMVR